MTSLPVRTGIDPTPSPVDIHTTSVISCALGVFCTQVHHDVCKLMHMGMCEEETPEQLFSAAAKRLLLDPACGTATLQDIVESVIASPDGMPLVDPSQAGMLNIVMAMYPEAKQAYATGQGDAFRRQRLLPQGEATIADEELYPPAAMAFLQKIDDCEEAWEHFEPKRPFECMMFRYLNAIGGGES